MFYWNEHLRAVGVGHEKGVDAGVSPENPAFVEEIFGPAAVTLFI